MCFHTPLLIFLALAKAERRVEKVTSHAKLHLLKNVLGYIYNDMLHKMYYAERGLRFFPVGLCNYVMLLWMEMYRSAT